MSRPSDRNAAAIEHYRRAFAASSPSPPDLAALRGRALDCFIELGLPTRRLEEWRYTNASRLTETLFESAASAATIQPAEFDALELPDLGGERIVFVDGTYCPDLTRLDDASGLAFSSLAASGDRWAAGAARAFTSIADFKEDAFSALNTALGRDAAILEIASGEALPQPIHLVFVSTPAIDTPRISFPRILIRAGAGSQARVVEDHLCLDPTGTGLITASVGVSEIILEADAGLEHVILDREAANTGHIARQRIHQARDSRYTIRTFDLGGAIIRNDLGIVLGDAGAECDLQGLALGDSDQIIDNHTLVDHAMPHCTSRELYKGIYGDDSTGVFRGRVIVRPDAQRTRAVQQNRNLLLTRRAEVDAKPQLEIYADDVECSHGSSIGQLDPDALFFMRSRGLDDAAARALLSEGFANEVTDLLADDETGRWIRSLVSARLHELFAKGSRS